MNNIKVLITIILIACTFTLNSRLQNTLKIKKLKDAFTGVSGGQIFSTGGQCNVKILSQNATYNSDLVYYINKAGPYEISSSSQVGYSTNLGPFTEGDEIVFALSIKGINTILKMGPGTRNIDYQVHAKTNQVALNVIDVGFSDSIGGQTDFSSVVIRVTGDISPVVCSSFSQKNQCKSQSTCLWNSSNCTNVCPTRPEDACTNDGLCFWDSDTCVDTCPRRPDENTCGEGDGCQWTGSICVEACTRRPDDESCIADSICIIGINNTGCVDACSIRSQNDCTSDANCLWSNNTCVDSCARRDNLNCFNDNLCAWDGKYCVDNTCGSLNSNDCVKNNICYWNLSQCARDPCPIQNTQQGCTSNFVCIWNNGGCTNKAKSTYGSSIPTGTPASIPSGNYTTGPVGSPTGIPTGTFIGGPIKGIPIGTTTAMPTNLIA